MTNVEFLPLRLKDLLRVKEIYEYYINNSTYTFHTGDISIEELEDFIYISNARYLSYGIWMNNQMIGYTYLAPYKKRQAYYRTAEITFYLEPKSVNLGIGKKILAFMEIEASNVNFKTLLAVVTSSNTSSCSLLSKSNYDKCGHLKHVGEKFNKLLDIYIYQKEI